MEKFSFETKCIDFKGVGNGSSIVITGAVHGNEQTGTYAAELVAQKLAGEKILGNVRIIPVCNESAFKARQRQAVEDGEDLNRIFPGKEDGTYSEQLANHIWNLTEGYDYMVDLHCCGLYGSEYTMCWYSKYDFQKTLSTWMGVKTVIHTAGTGGQMYLEACEKRGQKSLLIELPGGQPGGVINLESSLATCDKLMNYLKLTGVIEGEGVVPEGIKHCGVIAKGGITADEAGVYHRVVAPGSYVNKGDAVAKVDDKEYFAPFDAVVTASSIERYVFKGDQLVSFAPSKEVQAGEV